MATKQQANIEKPLAPLPRIRASACGRRTATPIPAEFAVLPCKASLALRVSYCPQVGAMRKLLLSLHLLIIALLARPCATQRENLLRMTLRPGATLGLR